jgi:cephalosporin hydroxylase
MPEALRPYCGQGLRIWQYPIQLSRYLEALSQLRVRSYLELGVRHGGAFVTTVEYLERHAPLDFAVAVDLLPCPSMEEYRKLNPRASFERLNTQSPELAALVERLGFVDLVFVDSHHEEAQCRRELEVLLPRAGMIALHDIVNRDWPGIGTVWEELKRAGAHRCFEFTEQYGDLGPYMGIGLAVRKDRASP